MPMKYISNDDCYYTRHIVIFSLNGIRFIFVCISRCCWPAVRCTTAKFALCFSFRSFCFCSRNSSDSASEFMIDNDSLWSICGGFESNSIFTCARPQTPWRAECAELATKSSGNGISKKSTQLAAFTAILLCTLFLFRFYVFVSLFALVRYSLAHVIC